MIGVKRHLAGPLAAMLLGLAVFLFTFGWWVLIPTNIAWLDTGDRAMHQLGWMFYRDAPWLLPPGLSPRLGMELATSISLVDGLPLVAMPLKLIAPFLPQPFQFWGWYLLASYLLQSLFAYGIARRLGAGVLAAVIAAGFALITPAFLFRAPLHMALSSHWVVLAALWLYLDPAPRRPWVWPLLAMATAAIHATLLAMVLAIWVAALAKRLWLRRLTAGQAALEVLLAASGVAATLWLVGFFVIGGDYGSFGYGWYKLNLLWPITSHGWSEIFPDIPHTRYDYEGMSFLGIGILALLAICLVTGALAPLRRIIAPQWLPLAVILLGLMLFAFSKTPSFGEHDLGTIPMPGFVETLGEAFRSTGRFVWPLLYLITIGAVVLIARKLRPAIALPLVAVAFAAQAADTAPRARIFVDAMNPPAATWSTTLTSPFWEAAARSGITAVRHIRVRSPGIDWLPIGYYAVTYGLATDSAYLARIDRDALAALDKRADAIIVTGHFDPGTLYILDMHAALGAAGHLAPGDFLGLVDSRFVLLKDGAALAARLGLEPAFPVPAD